jgi:prepilin-type N-terminal cleavage/methylation domain-containing protein
MGAAGKTDSGFTILEALVALAILAAALIPLLGMQSQFVDRIAAQERLQTRLSLESALVAALEDINLQLHQSGQINGVGYRAEWQAAARGPAASTRISSGEPARFDLQAYTVTIRVVYEDGRQELYRLPGLGWRAKWAITT